MTITTKFSIGDEVEIDFSGTQFEGNDFIPKVGKIAYVLNDAIKDTCYLVNGFWFNDCNLTHATKSDLLKSLE